MVKHHQTLKNKRKPTVGVQFPVAKHTHIQDMRKYIIITLHVLPNQVTKLCLYHRTLMGSIDFISGGLNEASAIITVGKNDNKTTQIETINTLSWL